ncbi:(Na+)-NQR maturation NqrM [Agarilytica rhodophyticola]|uniref:(Na+)-NQR maturation NqrM n=1 Tax=Agarilytica rhodophyticola TaxID=1737490 RepID=UPI000B341472|nr:(Na+)-NQR maturation NqrM [Agarilytica rhodophyticola]
MVIYLLSFVVLMIIIIGMSIGVILANKPIKGSCGGMAALGIDTECDICGGDQSICETENAKNKDVQKSKTDLAYDASK